MIEWGPEEDRSLQQINRSLAKKMLGICKSVGRPHPLGPHFGMGVSLEHGNDSSFWVSIAYSSGEDCKIPLGGDEKLVEFTEARRARRRLSPNPAWSFESDLIRLEVYRGRENVLVTTRYGVMPSLVCVPDGRVLKISNSYIFKQDGQAAKLEQFYDLTFGGKRSLGKFQLIEGQPIEVDLSLDGRDSRCTELHPGDYEFIGGILHQIELGEFRAI